MHRLILDWCIPESVNHSIYRLQDLLVESLETHALGTLEPGHRHSSLYRCVTPYGNHTPDPRVEVSALG